MKKLVIGMVAAALVFSNISAHANSDAFNPLAIPVASSESNLGFMEYVVEGGGIQNSTFIALRPQDAAVAGESRVWQWCTGLKDPLCDPALGSKELTAVSVLGPCMSASEENCIDSLEVGDSKDSLQKAKLIRLTGGDSQPAAPEYNYPGSSTISLWSVPGSSTTYAVTSTTHLGINKGKFYVGDFYADVTPYREQTGAYRAYKVDTNPNTLPKDRYNQATTREYWSCVFEEDGICGIAQNWPEKTRVKLKVRLSKDVGGWFKGRIQDPSLDVQPFSANNNLITIEASSVTVPRLTYVTTKNDFSPQEKAWFSDHGQWPSVSAQATGVQASASTDAFAFISYFRDRLKDTATGVNNFWNVSTTAWGNGSSCLQDKSKVLGIVTTNAMAYDGNSPSFEDGSLNYHVSGLHFMPDGVTPVQGTYNLVMRSETARCLYGLSPAPVKASISISGNDSAPVATVVTGESNGWLSLSAAGFTFSEKNIKVKLTQDVSVVVPAPAPSVAPTTAPVTIVKPVAKPISITCVKGKTSKKVTAVNPACPSGYKKK